MSDLRERLAEALHGTRVACGTGPTKTRRIPGRVDPQQIETITDHEAQAGRLLAADPTLARRYELGEAWEAAEALAGKRDWAVRVMVDGPGYRADAYNRMGENQVTGWSDGGMSIHYPDDPPPGTPRPTPTAALLALAARLREGA